MSSPKLNGCGLQKLLLLFESADSNISGYCCVAFLTHCQLGMVIYYRLTLVVLTQCFARHTGGSLDRTFTIEELGAEADIKLLKAIVGNLAHHLYQLLPAHRPTQYSLQKRGHPFLLPTLSTTYFRSTFINQLLFQSV